MVVKKSRKKKDKDKKVAVEADDKDHCIHCHEDMRSDYMEALGCEICDMWSCRNCINVPEDVYKFLEESPVHPWHEPYLALIE